MPVLRNDMSLKEILSVFWYIYRSAAIICFTGLISIALLLFLYKVGEYVELPNGMRLTQSLFRDIGKNGFVLEDENGSFVLSAKSGEIASQGDYVFGMASRVSSGDKTGDSFVYKRGWPEPLIFSDYSESRKALDKYNLRGSIDIPPNIFERESYKKCTEYNRKDECTFNAYDEYWQSMESGKEKPYKCKKNSKETCHSYGIYKTYLSLKKIRKLRNWLRD